MKFGYLLKFDGRDYLTTDGAGGLRLTEDRREAGIFDSEEEAIGSAHANYPELSYEVIRAQRE